MPLFQIQDSDRPVWVIAPSYGLAVEYYDKAIAIENECEPGEVEPPTGVCHICEDCDILIGPSDCFLDAMPDKEWHRNIDETLKHFIWPLLNVSHSIVGETRVTLQDMVLVRLSKWTDDELIVAEAYVSAVDLYNSDQSDIDLPAKPEPIEELERFVAEATDGLTK